MHSLLYFIWVREYRSKCFTKNFDLLYFKNPVYFEKTLSLLSDEFLFLNSMHFLHHVSWISQQITDKCLKSLSFQRDLFLIIDSIKAYKVLFHLLFFRVSSELLQDLNLIVHSLLSNQITHLAHSFFLPCLNHRFQNFMGSSSQFDKALT